MERLHKVLAHAGFGSRRKCEELIRAGLVRVDGRVITEMGVKVDPRLQDIRCAKRRVRAPAPVVYLVNKPRNYLSTTKDEHGRKTVLDLVPHKGRLYPAGRLDADSQGMILLTNDGDLCNRITHPRHGVEKSYHVVVRGSVPPEVMERVRRGIWLAEGRTSQVKLRLIKRDRQRTIVEITLREGKKREVRRLFARFGLKVRRLKRIRIGGLNLGSLKEGQYRLLLPDDIGKIFKGHKKRKLASG